MASRHTGFDDMETECGECYHDGGRMFRISIKKHGSAYRVHKHIFHPQKLLEEVDHSGSLTECITHVKHKYEDKEIFSDE